MQIHFNKVWFKKCLTGACSLFHQYDTTGHLFPSLTVFFTTLLRGQDWTEPFTHKIVLIHQT